MKLRLPLFLPSFILAIPAAMPAAADVIGNGVCYDVGKACYSSDPNITSKLDELFCWAAGSSNIIQYWQDTYCNSMDVPNGVNKGYTTPTGTMYLNVYQNAYDNGRPDQTTGKYSGGFASYLIDWWMKGTPTESLITPEGFEGYYKDLFPEQQSSSQIFTTSSDEGEWVGATCWGPDPATFKGNTEGVRGGDNSKLWNEMSQFIIDAFAVQGRALALNIRASHVITCWGYETNDQGLVTTLILSDSDDSAFGTFRAQIQIGDSDATEYEGFYLSYGERLMLSTDDQKSLKYSIGLVPGSGEPSEEYGAPWITSFTYIDTPEPATKVDPDSDLSAAKAVTSNVRLTENKQIEGNGIVVGDTQQAIVLTSAKNSSLVLDGQKSGATGMKVMEGAMVSLCNVEITNYQDSGVESIGKAYFHDGEVVITGNSTGENGGAANNANYLEFLNNEKVTITDNTATGKGGAISNTNGATVSIRGNKEVEFRGNKATGGANDIYNGAGSYLNIADNGSVTFTGTEGKAAIINDGELYLRAQDGNKIAFNNSSLNSDNGTTYVGKDIQYRDNDIFGFYVFDTNEGNGGSVEFKDTAGHTTTLQANPNENASLTYATLENLSVSAGSILGAGDNGGVVSNALITSLGGMTMSNLKLDTTDSVNSLGNGFTSLDKVVLTLTDSDMEGDTFDLTNVLTGNLMLNEVVFDLSQASLTEDALKGITFNLSSAYADKNQLDLYFKVAQGQLVSLVDSGSKVLLAAAPLPEPTTGTLSLLALAALAARRKRKG